MPSFFSFGFFLLFIFLFLSPVYSVSCPATHPFFDEDNGVCRAPIFLHSASCSKVGVEYDVFTKVIIDNNSTSYDVCADEPGRISLPVNQTIELNTTYLHFTFCQRRNERNNSITYFDPSNDSNRPNDTCGGTTRYPTGFGFQEIKRNGYFHFSVCDDGSINITRLLIDDNATQNIDLCEPGTTLQRTMFYDTTWAEVLPCSTTCENGGECKISQTNNSLHECHCPKQWIGDNCTIAAVCDPVCENGGICFIGNECNCSEGWTGPSCTSRDTTNSTTSDSTTTTDSTTTSSTTSVSTTTGSTTTGGSPTMPSIPDGECHPSQWRCDPRVTCQYINGQVSCGACPYGTYGDGNIACFLFCGDGNCTAEHGEDCISCPSDCRDRSCGKCGDGTCDGNEDCSSCFKDCGPCDKKCDSCEHGTCKNGICECFDSWVGPSCSTRKTQSIDVTVNNTVPEVTIGSDTLGENRKFRISIRKIDEVNPSGEILRSVSVSNISFSLSNRTEGLNTVYNFSAVLDNTALLNFRIYGEFLDKAVIDERVQVVSYHLNSDNTVTAILPHFWKYAEMDPNYNVLVGDKQGDCNSHNKSNNEVNIVAIMVPVVVVAFLAAMLIFLAPRLWTRWQLRKANKTINIEQDV